jgi:hypothetical protein
MNFGQIGFFLSITGPSQDILAWPPVSLYRWMELSIPVLFILFGGENVTIRFNDPCGQFVRTVF